MASNRTKKTRRKAKHSLGHLCSARENKKRKQ